ncbi:hypothetical protein ACR78Z_04230 [Sphingobacterium thalpophilum]|uniref:Uncharacterized protein n=1 Tax=Sphingobacterium thalpophilum TaxID=259 RepID=A0A4U9W4H8_9SPHI|nr:hypothetical protein [Sphingobacterium thalpophilum]VTR53616.1 Uncharacterised protein [Sphingobacterium thalpophilum]
MENNKSIIEILDDSYKGYLAEEGKWLNEGFKNIFVDGEPSRENLKTPIYLMLPEDIREHVDKLLGV